MRLGLALALVLGSALPGCGSPAATARGGGGAAPPPGASSSAVDQVGADAVTVYTDGATATAALVAAVGGARTSVDAEIYEFDRPDLVAAMIAATHRGVRVRVIGDPTVEATVGTGRRLAAAGSLVAFFPVVPRQIDHVKLLLVDGVAGYFGGVNWGRRSYLNRDYELRVEGPAVNRLARIFALDLARSGRTVAVPADQPPTAGEPLVLTTYPDDQIGRAVVAAISAARRSIVFESFVLTDGSTIAALVAARARGVAVQALFDPGQDLNQAAVAQLRPRGIACRFYRSAGEKLHAKTAVIDGSLLIVGSANWTASGFRHNHELDALLTSQRLAAAVLSRMDRDWAAAA